MVKSFNRNSFAVGISNYRRPRELFYTLRGWLASTPPGTRIYILHNTWQDNEEITNLIMNAEELDNHQHSICQIFDNTRHSSHWVCLAESWNTLIQHILDEHEWVILSQDDVIINPEWLELLEQNPFYYYQANFGDQVVCFGRELFNMMPGRGWYDQRIRMVGVHDMEFAKRVIRTVGLRGVCIESVCDGFINPIGLYNCWQMADQKGTTDVGFSRRKAQAVRERLGQDLDGNLVGVDDAIGEVVPRACSQYVLVHRGATDTRPYVDVTLDYIRDKWGGWDTSNGPAGGEQVREYVEDDEVLIRKNIPEGVIIDYGIVTVYDKEEDITYWETAGSPRCWKEGEQTIPDIDWHPYFRPREARING